MTHISDNVALNCFSCISEEVIIKNIRKNPRIFHSYIKSGQKVKQLTMHLEKVNDSVTNGPCDVAETFAKHFNSVFIKENTDNIPNFCSRTQHEIVNVKLMFRREWYLASSPV